MHNIKIWGYCTDCTRKHYPENDRLLRQALSETCPGRVDRLDSPIHMVQQQLQASDRRLEIICIKTARPHKMTELKRAITVLGRNLFNNATRLTQSTCISIAITRLCQRMVGHLEAINWAAQHLCEMNWCKKYIQRSWWSIRRCGSLRRLNSPKFVDLAWNVLANKRLRNRQPD